MRGRKHAPGCTFMQIIMLSGSAIRSISGNCAASAADRAFCRRYLTHVPDFYGSGSGFRPCGLAAFSGVTIPDVTNLPRKVEAIDRLTF